MGIFSNIPFYSSVYLRYNFENVHSALVQDGYIFQKFHLTLVYHRYIFEKIQLTLEVSKTGIFSKKSIQL